MKTNINTITLQFSTEYGILSALIRWFSAGPFSHVDAVLDDSWLLGARLGVRYINGVKYPSGVQIRPPDYANFKSRLIVRIPVSEEVCHAFYTWWKDQIGKPYDISAIIGFAAGRDWRKNGEWYCSEGIGRGMELSKAFPHELYTPTNKLTPPGLLLAISVLIPMSRYSYVVN